MNILTEYKIGAIIQIIVLSLIANNAFSATSFGLGFSKVNSEQGDLNTLQKNANTRAGGIGAGELESGFEISGFMQYRFDGSAIALQLRPGYFFQEEDGSGGNTDPYIGNYKYATSGYNVTGLLRTYALEGPELRLYFQAGVAWGKLELEIQEVDYKAKASGSNLGYVFGAGIELIFGAHNFFVEANNRYLVFERNIVDSTSGTPATGTNPSTSQTGKGQELEAKNEDLQTNMSGLQMMAGYSYTF